MVVPICTTLVCRCVSVFRISALCVKRKQPDSGGDTYQEDLGLKVCLTTGAKERTNFRDDAVVVRYGEHNDKQQPSSTLVESDGLSNGLTPELTKIFVVLRPIPGDPRSVGSTEIKLPLGADTADTAISPLGLWYLRMTFEVYTRPPTSTVANWQLVAGSPSALVWVNMELYVLAVSRGDPSTKVAPRLEESQHTPGRLRRASRGARSRARATGQRDTKLSRFEHGGQNVIKT
ncbi:hypothetical protein C8Q73DRAFT_449499 [Cubamyces lactineus]|nr:hypothetical protein C8Q73DRAFT_449499 [Cubamyces lactineus]